MIKSGASAVALAVGLLVSPALADPAPAPSPTPDVSTLLFETPQWSKAPVGTSLTYSYSKTTEAAYGPSFADRISLKLEKGDKAEDRTVDVEMFSGEHVKAAGPFQSDAQNPVMLLALEANVEDLSHAWHANPRYLKSAVRKAWRDQAKVEKTQIEIGGKSVPGTRITIEPFKDDPEKDKMLGLETMVYVIEVSDDVPGQIVTVDVHAPAAGPAKFSEILRYQPEKSAVSAQPKPG